MIDAVKNADGTGATRAQKALEMLDEMRLYIESGLIEDIHSDLVEKGVKTDG